jgi:hypothetical protein
MWGGPSGLLPGANAGTAPNPRSYLSAPRSQGNWVSREWMA